MSDIPLLKGISEVADIGSASDFEKKHTPHIVCSRKGAGLHVQIAVGHGIAHPSQADHFINWISLSIEDAPVARFDLGAAVAVPDVSVVLDVETGTQITAVGSCNLHGLWAWTVTAP
ncbi:MAG: hypothetical protein FWE94_02035 [Coriobacteriia bacterium]|nr:hypothetical protein [Coriobacteriia bacterium]